MADSPLYLNTEVGLGESAHGGQLGRVPGHLLPEGDRAGTADPFRGAPVAGRPVRGMTDSVLDGVSREVGGPVSTSVTADGWFGMLNRGPDPRAARSRAAALRAAQELLAEQGRSAVTHAAVAARSGVGRTTLYRHWPDPTALLHDAIAQRMSQVRSAPTGKLRADLVQELNGLRILLHDPVTERGMRAITERAGIDPAFTGLKEALYQLGTEGYRSIIGAAKVRGELPATLDPDLAVDQLAGPLMFRRLLADQTFDTDYVEAVVDSFLRTYGSTD
jgi:AcrR family transcriptional regulator